jgi:hypothetical protein
MVGNLTIGVLRVCLLLTLAVPHLAAQDSRARSNPASAKATKQQEGLFDFALKRFNPSDVDYGQCLDDGRRLMIEQTLSHGYFWSNVAALGLLGAFFIVIVHQQRLHGRHELIAAESLTQYHNALARAEAVAEEAITRNHQLMEALTALSEPGVTGESVDNSALKDSSVKERKRVENSGETGTPIPLAPVVLAAKEESRRPANSSTSVTKAPPGTTSKTSEAADQITLFGEADLTAKINSLQQRLDAYLVEKKELVRQISFAELRLQKEQQKNRSLKGE